MASPLAGPAAYARAVGLLARNPSLVVWGLVPAAVTFVLSVVAIWAAISDGDDLLARLWTEPEAGWLHWIWVAGRWLLSVASALLSLFVTPWLVMLVGLPLCEPLAERADALLGGPPPSGGLVAGIVDSLVSSLGILALGLAGAIGFFILGLIPGVALITTPFVAFVWTPMFLAFDLYDGNLARRKIPFRRKLALTFGHPVHSVGLGLIGGLLISIPVVNLFGLPIAVVAGVAAVRDLETRGALRA